MLRWHAQNIAGVFKSGVTVWVLHINPTFYCPNLPQHRRKLYSVAWVLEYHQYASTLELNVNHSLSSWNTLFCTCTHKTYNHWPAAHTQPTVIQWETDWDCKWDCCSAWQICSFRLGQLWQTLARPPTLVAHVECAVKSQVNSVSILSVFSISVHHTVCILHEKIFCRSV